MVAAQGPQSDGGDRGLYRTTDGGTPGILLSIDEHTGINEFVVDPEILTSLSRRAISGDATLGIDQRWAGKRYHRRPIEGKT